MNKYLLLLCCIPFIVGCGTLSKSAEEQTGTEQYSSGLRLEQRGEETQVVVNHDSSVNDVVLEIKPTGTFRYSVADGFNGHAEYVRLSAKTKTGSLSMLNRQNTAKVSLKQLNSGQSRIRQQSNKKISYPASLWLYLTAGLLVLGAGIWLFKKYRPHKN